MKRIFRVTIGAIIISVIFLSVLNQTEAATVMTNSDTGLTVNVVIPQVWWIGFNDTTMTPRMDQVDVNEWYYFTMFGNYSEGWENCRVDVEAWYDGGNLGGASAYPGVVNGTRNLAFNLSYIVSTGNFSCNSINNGTEIKIGGFTDVNMNDNVLGQENHTVGLEIFYGSQVRNASGNGFTNLPGYYMNPNFAFVNPFSWDFCIKLSDARVYPLTKVNVSYGEFGIKQAVSVSVQNNPSGNGPPGANNVALGSSYINYSSNSNYRVNISIPDVYLNGDELSPYKIDAIHFRVQNMGPFADASNSQISSPLAIPGPMTPLLVWGTATPIAPIGNGTTSNGPFVSNFNAAQLGEAAITEVQWWVNIPIGIPEGAYWAYIYISVYT
jgi:hypothetical protein